MLKVLKPAFIALPSLLLLAIAQSISVTNPELAPILNQILVGLGVASPSLYLVKSPIK